MSVRQRAISVILDILFPPRCVGCRERGNWLCSTCLATAKRLPTAHCRRCAIPTMGVATCPNCWRDPPAFDQVSCAFLFEGPIRAAIHALKYHGARHLAEPLVEAALTELNVPAADLIVPVPLFAQRLAERGYNQSTLLARAIGTRSGTPLVDDGLQRIRDTPAQVSLPAKDRWQNVRGAFRAEASLVGQRSVLLVDDVATTGSTLRAASEALKRGGARQVNVLVVARTASHQ